MAAVPRPGVTRSNTKRIFVRSLYPSLQIPTSQNALQMEVRLHLQIARRCMVELKKGTSIIQKQKFNNDASGQASH
jgi:hypothetical protein